MGSADDAFDEMNAACDEAFGNDVVITKVVRGAANPQTRVRGETLTTCTCSAIRQEGNSTNSPDAAEAVFDVTVANLTFIPVRGDTLAETFMDRNKSEAVKLWYITHTKPAVNRKSLFLFCRNERPV